MVTWEQGISEGRPYQNKSNLPVRKFWREFLPGIKFYNPSLSITVRRHFDTSHAPYMSIDFGMVNDNLLLITRIEDKAVASKVYIRNKKSNEICDEFIKVTNAKAAEPFTLPN